MTTTIRTCMTCKHDEAPHNRPPCLGCGGATNKAFSNWEARDADAPAPATSGMQASPAGPPCDTCKHVLKNAAASPCRECKHSWHDQSVSMWEPRDAAPAPAPAASGIARRGGMCSTCKHTKTSSLDEPCVHCVNAWLLNPETRWEARDAGDAALEAADDARDAAPTSTPDLIRDECDAIRDMLLAKNAAYGDSALDPVRIFATSDPVEQIRVRIDDKLSRLSRGAAAGEDVVRDLIGYLVLLRIAERRATTGGAR